MADPMPLDKLAKVYRKIRAAMTELTQKYEAELQALTEQRDQVALAMKDQMMALGTKSIRTEQGTIMLNKKTRYYTQDWDAFKEFVLIHQALDLFEKRIAQSNMATFLESNPGVIPPGLNSESEYVVSVRKPN